MPVGFTYQGRQFTHTAPYCPQKPCSESDVSAWRGYATQLMGELYKLSLQGDGSQQSELQIDYCEIVDSRVAAAMQLEAQGAETASRAYVWFLTARAAAAKLGKYGFTNINPTFASMPQTTTPPPCRGDKIPEDDSWIGPGSWVGGAANTIDDVLKSTGNLVNLAGKFLPILLVLTVMTKVGSVVDVFGGGGRRCR